MGIRPDYVTPKVLILQAGQIVEALGPVSAGSSSGATPCVPNGWMGNCPV